MDLGPSPVSWTVVPRFNRVGSYVRENSTLFVQSFMSHSAQNFRKEILLFLRKFLVLWMKRGVSCFSVENFWSHSAEKFCGHPFKVSENLGASKNFMHNRGITLFRQKFFVSQCRKISLRNPSDLCFRKFLVAKKFMFKRGGGSIKIFRRKFFVSQCRKIS